MLLWWQLWLGVAIAAVLFAPNLIWQWQHGWPFFEVILPHLESQKNFTGPFWLFELRQALLDEFVLAPLWLAGAVGPFVDRRLRCALPVAGLRADDGILFSAARHQLLSVSGLSDDVRGRRGVVRAAGRLA